MLSVIEALYCGIDALQEFFKKHFLCYVADVIIFFVSLCTLLLYLKIKKIKTKKYSKAHTAQVDNYWKSVIPESS